MPFQVKIGNEEKIIVGWRQSNGYMKSCGCIGKYDKGKKHQNKIQRPDAQRPPDKIIDEGEITLCPVFIDAQPG